MGNILEIKNVTKQYPGVLALHNVSFSVEEGEVHALVGENGAGKSTLIKTITGAITPDEGTIIYRGEEYRELNPILSGQIGIEAIYQEFNLAGPLTVEENVYMGAKVNKGVFADKKALVSKTKKILESLNVDINPNTKIRDLTVAYMQLVEIAKALAKDVKLLIMDEPTAPLTDNEVEILFQLINKLKSEGVSIIYISHRMDEIFEVADRVTVMRDGEVIKTVETSETNKNQLIFDMVGRELTETYPKRDPQYGDKVLEIKDVSGPANEKTSFYVKKGEIVGLAGLVGAGRTEIARLIIGADKRYSGEIFVDGQKVNIHSPKDAINKGIAYVSEDRKNQGVLLKLPIRWNITLPILQRLSKFGFISKKNEKECVEKYKDALRIKAPSLNQLVGNLSGGNQQKVAVAKWLASESKVLILDEPTRGIDVGAKQEIYELINRLTKEGLGIIMISSEMEEIMGMSDRMCVMAEGKIVGELKKEEFSQDKILKYASNITA
ncbi:MAG: sugar ABC transporter ATP-binding protein [Lachnospiraceae bacterium]|nr:sugar ABC transporter ATP-binding protein [Lachnospiraceae bacterium]